MAAVFDTYLERNHREPKLGLTPPPSSHKSQRVGARCRQDWTRGNRTPLRGFNLPTLVGCLVRFGARSVNWRAASQMRRRM